MSESKPTPPAAAASIAASTAAALSRRRMFAGAGSAAALAAAAAVLPLSRQADSPVAAVEPKAAPDQGGGYQVTEHVLRYYQTTRI